MVKIAVVAPLSPPFGVDNVPFELVGRAFYIDCLKWILLTILLLGIQNNFTLVQVIILNSKAFQYNFLLILWPNFLTEAAAILARWNFLHVSLRL